jgi:hypothetical protein
MVGRVGEIDGRGASAAWALALALVVAAGGGCARVASGDDRPDVVCPSQAPRLRAPLSGGIVAAPRPLLRWFAEPGATREWVVEVSDQRAFQTVAHEWTTTEAQATPPSDLAPGVWFWRVRALTSCRTRGVASAVWQVHVAPAGDHPVPDRTRGWVLDLNGDGFADVAAGTPHSRQDDGQAYVFYGRREGLSRDPDVTLNGREREVELFGEPVATAGDVDGDGFVDLAVSAFSAANDTGRVYIYRGGPDGVGPSPAWTLTGVRDPDPHQFGRGIAAAGDVNGDGYADLVIGGFWWGHEDTGATFIFFGRAGGPAREPDVVLPYAESPIGQFGAPVGTGDVDGDGYDDVLVTAKREQSPLAGGVEYSGAAYLFYGAATARDIIDSRVRIAPPGGRTGTWFGSGVGSAGDVNGDGFADFAVAAQGAPPLGQVYIYHGGPRVQPLVPAVTLDCHEPEPNYWYGNRIVALGDVNGDGRTDLGVGMPSARAFAGVFDVHLSDASAGGLALTPAETFVGPAASQLGTGAGSADIDRDGALDLAIGANQAQGSGIVRVIFGRVGGFDSARTTTLAAPTARGFGFSVALNGP